MPDDRQQLRVVAHLADGSLVKGYLRSSGSFDPHLAGARGEALPENIVIEPPGRDAQVVDLKAAKALFFVHTLEGRTNYTEIKFFERNPQIEGLWVKIRFKDGETTEGIVHNSLPFVAGPGFFLRPPDPHSNNRVVYVVKAFLEEFRILGIRTEY